MQKANKTYIVLAILWFTCLILDIRGIVTGAMPLWLNMILAHICLITCNIDLALEKRYRVKLSGWNPEGFFDFLLKIYYNIYRKLRKRKGRNRL